MKKTLLVCLGFLGLSVPFLPGRATAFPMDVTSGTTGHYQPSQSYNETRGVDVTVLSADLQVTSMTLNALDVGPDGTAFVGARIYASPSGTLLASNSTTVFANGAVTLPISATLVSGQSYRISFYCGPGGKGADNSATLFDPDPSGGGGFPYVESTGSLRINQAYESISDSYPTNTNIFDPWIVIEADLVSGVAIGASAAPFSTTPASPNPFRVETSIRFDLRGAAPVRADVIDPAGRVVRVLLDSKSLSSGVLAIAWDGKDGEGRPAVSGVYFIRLAVGGASSVHRVQLLR